MKRRYWAKLLIMAGLAPKAKAQPAQAPPEGLTIAKLQRLRDMMQKDLNPVYLVWIDYTRPDGQHAQRPVHLDSESVRALAEAGGKAELLDLPKGSTIRQARISIAQIAGAGDKELAKALVPRLDRGRRENA